MFVSPQQFHTVTKTRDGYETEIVRRSSLLLNYARSLWPKRNLPQNSLQSMGSRIQNGKKGSRSATYVCREFNIGTWEGWWLHGSFGQKNESGDPIPNR